jgi:hypothetical protein
VPDYYKAVPKQFYENIRKSGLDPAKAGQPGGATAMSITVRQPTKYDKGYTWLGPYWQALDYAQGIFSNRDPFIIKVRIPEIIDNVMIKIEQTNIIKIKPRGKSGFTTKQIIGPQYIEVQTAKGNYFSAIAGVSEPYIITGNDQDFTDDW